MPADPLPRDPLPDSTLAALRAGYRAIAEGCERTDSDVYETRLLGRPVICLRGAQAAELFYDARRFEREGVLPRRIQKALFGEGGVHGLDGAMHRARKRWFVAVTEPARVAALTAHWRAEWRRAGVRWQRDGGDVVLLAEAERMACRAVCDWAGVPLPAAELAERAQDLAAMIAGAGTLGPRHWHARRARERSERWVVSLLDAALEGTDPAAAQSWLLASVLDHVDADESQLPLETAAVEVLNVLRPTVAVARYVVFAALALHEHPASHAALHDPAARRCFVQEVRRYYPFVPFVAARTRRAFAWGGVAFPAGALVLLDLHGTNHDARVWPEPEAFRPRRFAERALDEFELVPQGGGPLVDGHRCPGEGLTLALMDVAVQQLSQALRYDVPEQDLSVSPTTLPAQPASGFMMRDVRVLELATA